MDQIQKSRPTTAGFKNWTMGEAVPWFSAPTLQGNPSFAFDTVAGRFVLLLFAGSTAVPAVAEARARLMSCRDLLDDHRALFFGVTIDPEDEKAGRIAKEIPGLRWFLDYDTTISRLFGAVDNEKGYSPFWMLLDPMLRVVSTTPISEPEGLFTQLRQLLEVETEERHAPVAVIPRIFEPELCRHLVSLYVANGGAASGFMREVNGVTRGIVDNSFKRRFDYNITDESLLQILRGRIARRLLPMVERIFQFQATRIERHIVACYDGDGEGGYFRAHRDNTTLGTAHRRFACTINLNAEDYEGGCLIFPEFGPRRYRAPTGGAVVFSCSLQHEAQPVTKGKRYAYLPFLYDEAAARQREANDANLEPRHGGYRASD